MAKIRLKQKSKKVSHGKTKTKTATRSRPSKKRPTKKVAAKRQAVDRYHERTKENSRRGILKRAGHGNNKKWTKPKRAKQGTKSTVIKLKRQNLVINRKMVTISDKKSVKLSKNTSKKSEVVKALLPQATKAYKSLKKTKGKFKYTKLQYSYKYKGKTYTEFFSVGISKKSLSLKAEIEIITAAFEKNLQNYFAAGFSNIQINGIQVQNYDEKPKTKGKQ